MADIIVLNEITELLNSVNNGLTSTLSTINTNVNTANTNINAIATNVSTVLNNTKATTTESASGTLSAKLTYLINRRNRAYNVGSTNLKTLSSNISATTTTTRDSQTTYSSYTSEYICAYTGRYRVYCTGTVTVNTLGRNSNHTNSKGTDRNYLKFEVWVNGTTYTSDVVATQGDAVGTCAAATKTLDITMEAGQVIKARVVAITEAYNVPCWGVTAGNKITVNATDLSVRGSLIELTGSAMI